MNKTNKILYGVLALIIYVGFMVGFGFILNLFWKIQGASATMYWITTGVVCAAVAFYVILMLANKKDSGVGAIQLFFTLCLSFMPLVVRAVNMIPHAGITLSAILLFIVTSLYLITMVSMGFYATELNNNSNNKK